MEHALSLFVRSIFVDNMIFASFLGMCSYLAVSKKRKNIIRPRNSSDLCPADHCAGELLAPNESTRCRRYFRNRPDLSFVYPLYCCHCRYHATGRMVVERFSPSLYSALGIFLPLIAVNCAIMGACLFMQQRIEMDPSTTSQAISSISDAIVYALGAGLGWLLAIVCLAAINEKMAYTDVPKPLRGLGITFITVGLMAMAFMCFSGLNI